MKRLLQLGLIFGLIAPAFASEFYPGGQNFHTRTTSSLSLEDQAWMQQMLVDANAIQSFTRSQFGTSPPPPPSQDFLNLNPALQWGAMQAVEFLNELRGTPIAPFPDPRIKEDKGVVCDRPDKLEDAYVNSSYHLSKEEGSKFGDEIGGKSSTPIAVNEPELESLSGKCEAKEESFYQEGELSRQRASSPPLLDDTPAQKISSFTKKELAKWPIARESFKRGDYSLSTTLRALAHSHLEWLDIVVSAVDYSTFGSVTDLGDACDDVVQGAGTLTRRGVRIVTGDQRVGQNAGEFVAAGLSLVGSKKLIAPASIAKNLDKTRMIRGLDLVNAPGSLNIKRNAQGKLTGVTNTQRHHLIHRQLGDHPLWGLAGRSVEESVNRMLLPTVEGAKHTTTNRAIYQGSHTGEIVRNLSKQMDKAVERGAATHWDQTRYSQEIDKIILTERLELKGSKDKVGKALNKHDRKKG